MEKPSSSSDALYRAGLSSLPADAVLHGVTARPVTAGGRAGLRVALTEEIARDGVPGVDYIDRATMVELPVQLRHGRIGVDICARPAADAPDHARGFAGLAVHGAPGLEEFEAVYVRPTNGTLTGVGSPRAERGIQYFAYPLWDFARLRAERPGEYEAAAPVAPGRWSRLEVELGPEQISATVDGTTVLRVGRPLLPSRAGSVGLFVDIGTEAVFADLRVEEA